MTVPFADRHIGTDAAAQRAMLDRLGYSDLDALLAAALPAGVGETSALPGVLPEPVTEQKVLAELAGLAARNTVLRPLIGLGYHGTHTPPVLVRDILQNPSWYTAYTPYQPEISQGRLEALLNFQTMVADLTGLPVAGASLLDEATAAAEAMLLARRAHRGSAARFVVDEEVLPQTRAVLATRAEPLGIELVTLRWSDPDPAAPLRDGEVFGVLLQYPGTSGALRDPAAVIAAAREAGAIIAIAADLLALAVLVPPGEMGADIAVGTTQRFGVPLGYGGPHAAYMAVRQGLERQLPGRLVGVSRDADGAPAYRLTLQAREQHIRREKATSNICTAQVLLAVVAGMFAVYHGPRGIRAISERVAGNTARLAAAVREAGLGIHADTAFDTLRIAGVDADAVLASAREKGFLLLRVDDGTVQLSLDETVGDDDLVRIAAALGADTPPADAPSLVPPALRRSSEYLTHPVFSSHHSETAMMRYLRRLADMDYALDRGMIPLGSCTMKLNAAAEMASITLPGFAGLHPFAPADDAAGYLELLDDLETWLAAVTGYDTVSLQPNAGSQGELAGLLAIRAFHRSRGEQERDVCLIPSSAHGTNAASAVLAGMRVVVVACDDRGNVDLDDLRRRIDEHAGRLAALMITYPSTHGVYETDVRALTQAVHDAGGQVYIDGANLNALLGHARFGDLGGDVSHLNLHKTFCIPHGGGGPGVGPVAAKAHLAPFLPGHPQAPRQTHRLVGGDTCVHEGGPVSAAPYGSPGVLPISWAYLRLLGEEGLRSATGAAVLAANYVAVRLGEAYPVLYAGEGGLVAHECILDLRPLTARTGVTAEDVAKRLIDYGFHAPTLSFPVAGTLMVEPTESEDLPELDRFVDAMLAIHAEADEIAARGVGVESSLLRNAPHTAQSVAVEEWPHPYPRERAVFPVPGQARGKYWPPVRRVDQAFGDRNLVCACPPPEAFLQTTSGSF